MTRKSWIALSFGLAFTAVLLLSFASQVGGYASFAEVQDGERATVVGDSAWAQKYDREANTFSFTMRDQKGATKRVRYPAPKPANFDRAQKVVVSGTMRKGTFAADDILVKCPSKYKEQDL
jgi:cytochrome c-type biogenesis protein CcmE